MAKLTWQEIIARIEQAPKEAQTMVAKAFIRDDIDDENVQYLFNTESPEEMNDSDVTIENVNAEDPEGIGAAGFTMRTSKPANNKNYIRTGSGGWNTCIKGNPTDPAADVLSNCVGYASGRFNEIINLARDISGCTYTNLNCNAANFDGRAAQDGLEMGSTPKLGAIVCWGGGSQGAGHVAVVERVNSNNSIYTSESAYGGSAFYNSNRTNDNGRWGMSSNYWFKTFIYLPSDVQKLIEGQPTPAPVAGDHFKVSTTNGLWLLDDNKQKVRVYSNGTEVEFLNNGYDAYGYHYYHVKVLSDNAVGYMASSYLTPVEKPQPVPPTPPTPTYKYAVGDKVTIIGTGNSQASGKGGDAGGIGWDREILNIYVGEEYPYQVGNEYGTTGFYKESALKKTESPAPAPNKFKVGDKVRIIGSGSGSCYGNCGEALGIGWIRQVMKVWDADYPYQVGSGNVTTGFYKEDALEKV